MQARFHLVVLLKGQSTSWNKNHETHVLFKHYFRQEGVSTGFTDIILRQVFPGKLLLSYSILALICSDTATFGYGSGEELQMVFCLATVLMF